MGRLQDEVASAAGSGAAPIPARSDIASTDEVVPVLPQHRFDEAGLARFMAREVAGFTPPLAVSQFHGGMSNPTFLLRDGAGRKLVLRKKPPGKLLPSAHAVEREFKVIAALARSEVPVPRAVALAEDAAVIGQAFYLMEHVEGRVFRRYDLPGLDPAERARIYDAMNDVLARLHRVDYRALGLADYGREGGYAARQIQRWSKQYEASKTDVLPAMEQLQRWLPEHLPAADETTIVHGDFRLENMIWHPTEPRILAIVDWELGTLGHPLADLAYNALPWHVADRGRGDLMALTSDYGIPSEADYLAAYCRRTGRDGISDWRFYLVLSLFRLAAISQGVYKRGLDGNVSSPGALDRGTKARELAEAAWALAAG
ncbi:MAG TPA: phosphotransferase [Stellaceae bacterium]|nr:phosphotransferase [Stellaceae bacterium]